MAGTYYKEGVVCKSRAFLSRQERKKMEEKLPTESSQKPTVVTQKKKKGKKRRISKHIAEAAAANKKSPNDDETKGTAEAAKNPVGVKNKRRKTSAAAVKGPVEAASYLVAWQKRQQSGGSSPAWKFNKNTQSWLIRHMYEADKVSKGSFVVMLDYLKSGDKNTIQRCLEDATRRALRYQKSSSLQSDSAPTNEDKRHEAVKNTDDSGVDATTSTPGEDEEERWIKLDEHEKRKEYKRARKVLEALS